MNDEQILLQADATLSAQRMKHELLLKKCKYKGGNYQNFLLPLSGLFNSEKNLLPKGAIFFLSE